MGVVMVGRKNLKLLLIEPVCNLILGCKLALAFTGRNEVAEGPACGNRSRNEGYLAKHQRFHPLP